MDTFSPDNKPHMRLELSDESGVSRVAAFFNHLDSDSYIVLSGDGANSTEAVVDLTPSEHSGYLAPGEYCCRKIEASDAAGNLSTYTPQSHPQLVNTSFRYAYPAAAETNDTEGPVLRNVVANVFSTLTAPEIGSDDLKQYQSVLFDTLRSVRSVEETQEIVKTEIPGLAALTEEIARTRNVNARIAFIQMVLAIIGWILVSQNVNVNISDVDLDISPEIDINVEQDDHTPRTDAPPHPPRQ